MVNLHKQNVICHHRCHIGNSIQQLYDHIFLVVLSRYSMLLFTGGNECYSKRSKANGCSASCLCILPVCRQSIRVNGNTELQIHLFQGFKTNSSIQLEADFLLKLFHLPSEGVFQFSAQHTRISLPLCAVQSVFRKFKSSLLFHKEHSITII